MTSATTAATSWNYRLSVVFQCGPAKLYCNHKFFPCDFTIHGLGSLKVVESGII